MAVTITERGSVYATAGSGNLVSGSFTPAANSVLFLLYQQSGETSPGISSISGHGTWSNVRTWNLTDSTVELWACKVGASPSAGTVTVSRAYAWQGGVAFFEASGADVSGTAANVFGVYNSASKTGGDAASTITLSLGTFGAAGGVTFAVGTTTGSTSFEGGYTALTQWNTGSSPAWASGWALRAGYIDFEDTSVVVTSAAYTTAGAIAFEIKEASGGGSGIVSIKGNRGPRVAFGSARVGF